MSKGLGKGLGALIAMFDEEVVESQLAPSKSSGVKVAPVAGGVEEVDISLIDQNMNQPRKHFDPVQLQELADSISSNGIIQPVVLNRVGSRYLIVAGERRWRAAKLAGLTTIPGIVRSYSPRQIAEISIIENLQREDLNEIDLARGVKKLMDDFFLTQEKVATVLGKSRSSIANTLRLLNLPAEVREMIEGGQLTAGHGKCLVAVTKADACISLARRCVTGRLSVRELEDLVRDMNTVQGKSTPVRQQSPEIKRLANELSQALGTKVIIQGGENAGRIVAEYYDRRDLERLCEQLKNG